MKEINVKNEGCVGVGVGEKKGSEEQEKRNKDDTVCAW